MEVQPTPPTIKGPADKTVIDAARAVAGVFETEAAASESLRRPTDTAIDALVESGVLQLMVPRVYGGMEADIDTYVEVALALSTADTSLGWIANFYLEHHWWFCQFPESFQRELFSESTTILAPAMIAPSGRAEPVDGGWTLSGRWHWSSGVMHASWVIVGALSVDADGRPEGRFFAVPIGDVQVDDIWHIDGMCGTGSNDVVVDDVFVPADRVVSMQGLSSGRGPGADIHTAPLYRTPFLPILLIAATTPAIGAARRCVDIFRQRLDQRVVVNAGTKQIDKPAAQIRLARAELTVRSCVDRVRELGAELMEARDRSSREDRARWVATMATIMHDCRSTALAVSEASGANAHFLDHPLQRAVRDLNTMSGHIAFDLDSALENYGRITLGMEPSSPLL